MSMNIETILQQREEFVNQQLTRVEALWIETKGLLVDHICVRVDSDLLYDSIKHLLSEQYPMIWWEKIIGWRRISIFDIINTYWNIENLYDTLFELPAPKINHLYPNWLQHIELVYSWNLKDLLTNYSSINRNKDWFDKVNNRDISIIFPDMTEVKFHEQSLRDVLTIE